MVKEKRLAPESNAAKAPITIASIAALLMVAYHMVSSQVLLVGSVKHLIIHLGSAATVVYFFSLQDAKTKWTRSRSLVLLLLSAIIACYYLANESELMQRKFSNPLYEQVMGVVFILLILEAAREAFGFVLPLVTVIFIFYPILGGQDHHQR